MTDALLVTPTKAIENVYIIFAQRGFNRRPSLKIASESLPEKDLVPRNTNALEGRFNVKRGANLTNNRPILQVYHLI